MSWHSEGFPLPKAQAYVALRRPFLINDVHAQDLLLDRRRVYKLLRVRLCAGQIGGPCGPFCGKATGDLLMLLCCC